MRTGDANQGLAPHYCCHISSIEERNAQDRLDVRLHLGRHHVRDHAGDPAVPRRRYQRRGHRLYLDARCFPVGVFWHPLVSGQGRWRRGAIRKSLSSRAAHHADLVRLLRRDVGGDLLQDHTGFCGQAPAGDGTVQGDVQESAHQHCLHIHRAFSLTVGSG